MTAPASAPGGAPLASVPHLDDTGAPCTRHAALAADSLLQLAMVGSRASAFHHDCASKLQGLVMALDELSELSEHGDPQVLRAIEAAMESTRELHALLNVNRALTKPPARSAIPLGELVIRAAQRVGVSLLGSAPGTWANALSGAPVEIAVPAVTHALALAFDVAAGVGRGRSLDLTAASAPGAIVLSVGTANAPPSNASELLAIASYVISRDGGRLWCAAASGRLFLQLPAAA